MCKMRILRLLCEGHVGVPLFLWETFFNHTNTGLTKGIDFSHSDLDSHRLSYCWLMEVRLLQRTLRNILESPEAWPF